MWTYENKNFLKFCLIFLGFGSMLNLFFGLYDMNFNYVMNGILIGIVSVGIARILLFYKSNGG